MNRWIIPLIVILVVAAGAALFSINERSPSNEVEKIKVAVTINPYAEFVKKVGGEKVNVLVLVPPNADPHSFDLSPSTIKAMGEARVYFKVGAGLEFELEWLDKLAELNPSMPIVDTSVEIELIGSGEHTDPHIWLSPRNAMLIVDSIYKGLAKVDPDGEKLYRQNRDAYLKDLETLDREIEETLSNLRTRVFLVYHSAWAYFARDYNLKQIALEEEGKEPTVEEMLRIVESAKAEGIKAVFAEPLFDPRELEVITNELGLSVILVDTHSFTDYVTHIKGFALTLKETAS